MTEKRFIKPYEDCRIIKNIHTGETATYYDTEDGLMFLKWLNNLSDKKDQLKKELKKYTDAFDCSQCRFQNYDWFDDGDEFEVCEKGNNEAQMENHSCSEWEEIQ